MATKQENALPPALMTADELKRTKSLTEADMLRQIKAGRLPRPFMFEGKRCFLRSEVATADQRGRAVSYATAPAEQSPTE